MFYEEMLINDVLCFKTSPNGSWKKCSPEHLTKKYLDCKSELAKYKNAEPVLICRVFNSGGSGEFSAFEKLNSSDKGSVFSDGMKFYYHPKD
jgi:hypothetical protein